MSLVFTESWMQFARSAYVVGASTPGAGVSTTDLAATTAFRFAGTPYKIYAVNASHGAARSISMTLDVFADPLIPTKNRFRARCSDSIAYGYAIDFVVQDSYVGKRRVGMLIRPMADTSAAQPCNFGIHAGYGIGWQMPANGQMLFGFVVGASQAEGTTVAVVHTASGAVVTTGALLKVGTDYYVEVEMDTSAGTYRVWIDDLLVIDASMSAASKTASQASFSMRWQNVASGTTSGQGSWVSDMYVLHDDGIAPSARLGRTTRVMGEAPVSDVTVGFTRPAGATSNASVVGAQLSSGADPSVFLTGDNVGTRDLYAASAASYASLVHGVVVKGVASNYSSVTHSVSGVISDGTNSRTAQGASVSPGAGFKGFSAAFGTDAAGGTLDPADLSGLYFGLEITS